MKRFLLQITFSLFMGMGIIIPTLADHLPAENWSAMNPTVQVMSYQYTFSGYVTLYSSGSGTVINPEGLIVTNHHVVYDDFDEKAFDTFGICVTFEVKKEPLCNYTAKLIDHDKDLDIALLKMNPTDVFGKPIPSLKHLTPEAKTTPQEKDEVQVIGYPASGGSTITISKGQISGFEKFNDYSYFKTDTDFDHGSSGGTVLDKEGNYIGIPTYIRTYAENVGFFLDLNEALPWINEHRSKAIEIGDRTEKAEKELERELSRFTKANEQGRYETEDYPRFKVSLPKGWHFFEIRDDGLFLAEYNVSDGMTLDIFWDNLLFPVTKGYMDKINEDFTTTRQTYPDFKQEMVTFAGQEAQKISYTSYDLKNFYYYIPYGYSLITISYSLRTAEEKEEAKTIQLILDSFMFTGSLQKEPKPSFSASSEEPPFSITVADDWRIQKPYSNTGDRLATAAQQNNYEGFLAVYYYKIPQEERALSSEDRLKEISKWTSGIITKKDDVALDGLKGFLYVTEYESEKYQKKRKQMTVKVKEPASDYQFEIYYDDLSKNFDKNIPGIRKILNSFTYGGDLGEDSGSKGKYDFGSLGKRFRDLEHHRYANAISELADKEIVSGYKDGRFRPEWKVTKAEALKVILTSKNHLEKEKGLGKEVDFSEYQKEGDAWFAPYIKYAQEKRFISKNFRASSALNLAEALKLLMSVYEIPVWKGETSEWTKPYMDKAYELWLLPDDMTNPEKHLTRAELSYLVNTIYNQAK